MYVHTFVVNLQLYVHCTYAHICMCVMCMSVYVCVHMRVCVHACVCVRMCACVCIYTYYIIMYLITAINTYAPFDLYFYQQLH